MFINDVLLNNKNNLHNAIVQQLRSHGVKYRIKKTNNKHLDGNGGVLFGAPIHTVPRERVVCCGTTLQVPVLVHEACCFLRASVNFEGLFRKAGSQTRQRDIKRLLETGCKLDKSNHAVDIAGILKLYLRSLPEPLLNSDMQEVLLRCLLLPDNLKLSAIQNALLLLPPSYLELLHYIMEFFRYVSSKSEANKMDSNNLSIILTPGIMPLPSSYPPQRMEQHVRLIKILIENANLIGFVPINLMKLLEEDMEKENEEKTKKKRRSGSLTRMLNGLRKMVSGNSNQNKVTTPDFLATPVLDKCAGKRKQDEHLGLSAKKRKEILNGLPQQTLCTPVRSLGDKEYKRLRLSIGRKPKDKSRDYKMVAGDIPTRFVSSESVAKKSVDENKFTISNALNSDLNNKKENEFVTISKSEYEAIKQRVSAIESRLSQEFNVITSVDHTQLTEPVKQVQTAYEKTCEEAASLVSPTTEHLAKRLSRELKIRNSSEHKIIRSPSARKIGTLKRRSRENMSKLTRTHTWNVSSNTGIMNPANEYFSQVNLRRGRPNTVKSGLIHPTAVSSSPSPQNSLLKRRVSTGTTNFDNQVTNNNNSTSHLTRNQSKRLSCQEDSDEKPPATINNEKSSSEFGWKNAKSFLSSVENVENHPTGRASVAKLRSQNAGMVLAKAKLFDGMTDSDTSMEKKVSTKPIRHMGFARKPRKNINDSQNKHHSRNSSVETDTSASLTDDRNVKKRQRPKLTYSPVKIAAKETFNLSTQLKDVIYDVCTPMSDKISAIKNDKLHTPTSRANIKMNGGFRTPRSSTPGKKPLALKSNKNFNQIKNVKLLNSSAGDLRKQAAPMRTNQCTPRRQSPRLTSIKSRINSIRD